LLISSTAPVERVLVCGEGGDYEAFLASARVGEPEDRIDSEDDTISINYTSGTTGRPKGVMYTYRGAYLNALAEAAHARLDSRSVYLWTLPMFHCNGWCFTWAVTAVGARHVCLRKVDPALVWGLIEDEGVTHLNGAPTVLVMLTSDPAAHQLERPVLVTTAGAPPPPAVIDDVPPDGETMGEVVMRGNNVMKGYFADGPATAEAFRGGWFHSGDPGVVHPDGYIELRDRAKDIIISGGENISTIEVERALARHPDVLEAAVIAIPTRNGANGRKPS